MTNPGDIAPRRDTSQEAYVVVLSNSIHLAAATGRVITCPFIPGRVPDDSFGMVVSVNQPRGPEGFALPELVQFLPRAALDQSIGNIGPSALRQATALLAALVS